MHDHQHLTHALPVEAARCTSPQQPFSVVPTLKQPSQLVVQPVDALHADGAVLQTNVLEPLPRMPLAPEEDGAHEGSTPPAGQLQLQPEEVAAAAVLPCAEQQPRVAIPTSEQGEARIAATTFTEEADLDAGAYLLTHWDQLIPRSLHSQGQGVPPERALELFLLSARARRVEVTYRKSKSESEQGRWHALKSRSLQCLSRVARHTMCVGSYVDVDVVNAHPTLLLHLCRQSNWDCPQLSAYVEDRDKLLTDLCGVAGCSRDHAKQVYLAVLNGGDEDFNNLPRRSKHLEAFRNELAVLRLLLTQQHTELYAQVKARRSEAGKTWNNESSLLSLLCNRLENRVLMSMWCFFGCPSNCVLCFDGIMLRRSPLAAVHDVTGGYDLAGCAAHVRRELGVAIQLTAKPFDKCVTLPPREQVRGSFRRWLLPARFDPAKLHQLTKACTDESILEAMEPAQRKLAEEEITQNKKKDGLVGKAVALNVTAMLEYVNQYYFTVKGSTTVHCFEEHDAQGRVVEAICFTNKKALLEHLEDFKVRTDLGGLRNNKQAVNVGQLWLEYQQRRIYYKQKFAPNTTLAYTHQGFNERNMWTGWRYEQQEGFVVDTNLIARLTAHLLDVICAGQVELYTYLLKLWKLVLMGKKTGVALCVTGAQGSGKSLMVEYFGRTIIGDNHYAFFQTLDDLTGRFSSERCFKSFIVCDELGTWSGDHGTANKLKSLITQTRTKLERKGIDPRTVEDCSNFVFLSNDKDIVKVEGKADRRYCVVEASNHRLGDAVYFNALALDMGLEPEDSRLPEAQRQHAYSVGEHFFHFVLAQDVRGFKPSRIPATGIRQRLQAAATPPLAAFVRWFVDAYARELASKGLSGGAVRVKAANLFDGYERLMQYLGSPVKFLRAPELSKALKCKFQLFTDCAHRCASGTYFASTDPQRLEREARDLDSAHVFNTGMYQDVDFQFAEEN